eukprot:scaffold204885_cov26-Tisochrysis_lutea.AAC.1
MSSSPPRVGYQGIPGAYSEAASLEAFSHAGVPSITPLGFPSFEQVFHALIEKKIEYAVLPVENTLGGSIHQNYDLLRRFDGRVHIVGEHSLRVRHSLLALPGVPRDEIKKAMSHPQALAQTENYLKREGLSPLAAYDTAGSAQQVKEQGLRDTAAIASMHAAHVHGLEVLDYGIEDDANNFTRFVVLSRSPCDMGSRPRAAAKTSIVFTPHLNEAGALFKALSCFAMRDINLSKIESRPHRPDALLQRAAGEPEPAAGEGEPAPKRARAAEEGRASSGGVPTANFKYDFYVDLLVHVADERAQHALRHLREMCSTVSVLGCYPLAGVLLGAAAPPASPSSSGGGTLARASRLRVAIVGFGTFGQFLARRWVQRGHEVLAHSRTDYSRPAEAMGVRWVADVGDIAALKPDVVVVSTSILSFDKVLRSLPAELLRSALVLDVLSVKAYAKRTMLEALPPTADILCTHPMFGPDSGRHGWNGLPCVYDH